MDMLVPRMTFQKNENEKIEESCLSHMLSYQVAACMEMWSLQHISLIVWIPPATLQHLKTQQTEVPVGALAVVGAVAGSELLGATWTNWRPTKARCLHLPHNFGSLS